MNCFSEESTQNESNQVKKSTVKRFRGMTSLPPNTFVDDACVYKSPLNVVKAEKKKVESDVLLLSNRIALLKAEMYKAKRTIIETNKKASTIQQLQEDNERKFREKHELALARQAEIAHASEKNEKLKMDINMAVVKNISKIYESKASGAGEVKTARQEHAEFLEQQKRLNEEKVLRAKHTVQQAKEVARKKKEEEDLKKREIARIAFEKKVEREEQDRLRKLKEATRLEQEELALIAELQKTQVEQKQAFIKLEEALNTSKTSFVQSARAVAHGVSPLYRDASIRSDNDSPSTSNLSLARPQSSHGAFKKNHVRSPVP